MERKKVDQLEGGGPMGMREGEREVRTGRREDRRQKGIGKMILLSLVF